MTTLHTSYAPIIGCSPSVRTCCLHRCGTMQRRLVKRADWLESQFIEQGRSVGLPRPSRLSCAQQQLHLYFRSPLFEGYQFREECCYLLFQCRTAPRRSWRESNLRESNFWPGIRLRRRWSKCSGSVVSSMDKDSRLFFLLQKAVSCIARTRDRKLEAAMMVKATAPVDLQSLERQYPTCTRKTSLGLCCSFSFNWKHTTAQCTWLHLKLLCE